MPDSPGPFATEREADRTARELGGPPREGWSILSEAQREAALLAACQSAGVELGDYDKRIIGWLSGWTDGICGVVAGLVLRAAEGGRTA